ncbi:hypothetical protein XBJ1_1287 [Xenorhabdus bovienii SS-2004]|uniref:Uncharacterized protein n=1 Tax=Xenorhabdus bovienii (strain SS-2004) TaxID=406818 RepID=D3UXP5_XENBS|nr:hypothetical protein XBJ1_1287 [Xenorhabdus bovienii SS-2004]
MQMPAVECASAIITTPIVVAVSGFIVLLHGKAASNFHRHSISRPNNIPLTKIAFAKRLARSRAKFALLFVL